MAILFWHDTCVVIHHDHDDSLVRRPSSSKLVSLLSLLQFRLKERFNEIKQFFQPSAGDVVRCARRFSLWKKPPVWYYIIITLLCRILTRNFLFILSWQPCHDPVSVCDSLPVVCVSCCLLPSFTIAWPDREKKGHLNPLNTCHNHLSVPFQFWCIHGYCVF